MIDSDGHTRMCDFGLSKILEKGQLCYTYCGTPPYMPPEMVSNSPVYDAKVDLWSLAISIYEWYTRGELPFPEDDSDKMMKAISSKNPFNLSKVNKFNPNGTDFLSKMLEKNPKKRLGYSG